MDEAKLSKSLNGVRNFTSLELARIAQTGGRTVEWLISGRAPREIAFAARSAPKDQTSFLESGKALAEKFLHAHDALLDLNRGRRTITVPRLAENGSFVSEGARMAEWAIDQISAASLLGPSLRFNIALESAFGLNIASTSSLPDKCDGLSYEDPDADFRLILLATTPNWTRRRFTLAHELGHILWGDARCTWITEQLHVARTDDYKEKRANSFAANFLMPERLVREYLEKKQLSEQSFHLMTMRFKVSPSALIARLLKLGLVSESQTNLFRGYRSLDSAQATDAMAEMITEQSFSTEEMPPLFMLSQFVKAYLEGETTTRHLVRLSGIDAEQWRDSLDSSPQIAWDASQPPEDSDHASEVVFLP